MLFLQTTLPMNTLHTFFSNKIKGRVYLRRMNNGYILKCEPTAAYLAWKTHLHYHGSDTEYIDHVSVYIRPYLPSKL
jgi:hypothetical protein